MSKVNEGILAKIRALSAKTVASGCTEAEAISAASMVAKMLDRYGFDTADLEEREEITSESYFFKGKQLGAVSKCATEIALFCDVKVWSVRKQGLPSRCVYFGRETDVQVALYLTHLFHTAIYSAWQQYYKEVVLVIPMNNRRHGKTLKADFEMGMVHRLNQRLDEIKASRNATVDVSTGRTGKSLVLVKNTEVDAAFQALSMKLHSGGVSYKRMVSRGAFEAGQKAANRVSITTGVNSGGYSAALIGKSR